MSLATLDPGACGYLGSCQSVTSPVFVSIHRFCLYGVVLSMLLPTLDPGVCGSLSASVRDIVFVFIALPATGLVNVGPCILQSQGCLHVFLFPLFLTCLVNVCRYAGSWNW